MANSIDDLVVSATAYNRRSLLLHAYAGPFVFIHLAVIYVWLAIFGYNEYFEAGCIAVVITGLLQAVLILFGQWFVTFQCFMTCSQCASPLQASLIQVVPTRYNGSAELLPLRRTKNPDGTMQLWFEFQKVKYIFDAEEKKRFSAIVYPLDRPINDYVQSKGLDTDDVIQQAKYQFGDNNMEMMIPDFVELFKERALAPFFVFQVFCVLLWCLDEYWYYSVFTLCMLVAFEATLVKQQLRNMSEIRNMGNKPYMIQVYRCKRWRQILTNELVPGDIVSIGRSQHDNLVPCDLLLLRGPCIVDESMLTGESIPQMKEPAEELNDLNTVFDIDGDGKLHLLSGGTKIVQHTPPPKQGAGLKSPDNNCIAYVLRTGFNTSQGKLLRTILFGVKRVTANNLETFFFILFLLMFAIFAAGYLWVKGTEDESRGRYKLFLECTLILTSVVPPELPIELTLAVNNSLLALTKLGIFCTEPFRIPFAGKISIACFDKTGTLTTDNLVVEGIAGLGGTEKVCPLDESPERSIQVLVSCHSLVQLEGGADMVGDPLEKACLQSAQWTLTKNDSVVPMKRKGLLPLKIMQRFHFSSALKRMSAIVAFIRPQSADPEHLAVVKGAPEVLKSMFTDAPDNYDETFQEMTRQGARVLALGIRDLGSLSPAQIRESKRESIEKNLNFVGFVVISCPLKPDSKSMIREIQNSSHFVVMITGDNALTACHVAKELRFTRDKSHALILTPPSSKDMSTQWHWKSVDESEIIALHGDKKSIESLARKHDLCVTGEALSYLHYNNPTALRNILPHVKVYARVAPKQKESIITGLKELGFSTLMCGDGTNDVGALKHADVGVALLSHPLDPEFGKKLKSLTNERKSIEKEMADDKGKPSRTRNPRILSTPSANVAHKKRLEKFNSMLKDLEEEEKASVVKLGDASIAAPFTSKLSSIQCICHIIKQGRCTLVTTLQMFKILALNALILAYSQSVLYLDGVKFSDSQATIQGLLLAACFLFISRSKPLKVLSRQRPLTNVFNLYTLLTVVFQFAVHLSLLIFLVDQAKTLEPRDAKSIDLESKFKPNLLNTTVYIMGMALQVTTFTVNYRGQPFMERLWDNKALLYSLCVAGSAVVALAAGVVPDVAEQFELVPFTTEYRNVMVAALFGDFLACYIIDRVVMFLFGDAR